MVGETYWETCAYLILENLVPAALCEVLQQFFIRHHIGKTVGEGWVRKPAFFLLEFKICIHRQINCLEHTGK